MRRFCLLIVVATVLSVLLAGVSYLVMVACIPYERPTPAIASRDGRGLPMRFGDGYVGIVVPERDWTVKIGRGWYGVQGYPWGTRLVAGARSTMVRLPFPAVAALSVVTVVAFGTLFWYCAGRFHDERCEARAA